MIQVKWRGLKEFSDYLERLAKVARPRGPLMQRLEILGRMALENANVNTPVRTGKLRGGNRLAIGSMDITLYNDVEYAGYVHDRVPFLEMGLESVTDLIPVAGVEALEAV